MTIAMYAPIAAAPATHDARALRGRNGTRSANIYNIGGFSALSTHTTFRHLSRHGPGTTNGNADAVRSDPERLWKS